MMKNFKKILVLALAVIMCVTVLSVTSFADTFSPSVSISVRFNDEGTKLIAAIVTNQNCGAIEGKLTFSGTTFDDDATKTVEDAVKTDINYTKTEGKNEIKFVILTKNINEGDTHWADFYFDIPASGDVTFNLSGVNACDINETLKEGITVPNSSISFTTDALQTLGTQYRAEVPADGVKAALRFGAKVTRNAKNENSIELPEGATAIRCGFIWAREDVVTENFSNLTVNINTDGTIESWTTGAKHVPALKCLYADDNYLIYTVAIQNIPETYKGTKIAAVPYLVYKNSDGTYAYATGDQMTKTYDEVRQASLLLDGTGGYED